MNVFICESKNEENLDIEFVFWLARARTVLF